jgi:hypothetical protein
VLFFKKASGSNMKLLLTYSGVHRYQTFQVQAFSCSIWNLVIKYFFLEGKGEAMIFISSQQNKQVHMCVQLLDVVCIQTDLFQCIHHRRNKCF